MKIQVISIILMMLIKIDCFLVIVLQLRTMIASIAERPDREPSYAPSVVTTEYKKGDGNIIFFPTGVNTQMLSKGIFLRITTDEWSSKSDRSRALIVRLTRDGNQLHGEAENGCRFEATLKKEWFSSVTIIGTLPPIL
jgi:hypothetical protein